MTLPLTRRQFLILTSLSALATAFRLRLAERPVGAGQALRLRSGQGFQRPRRPLPPDDGPPAELGLGRVIAPRVTVRSEPNSKAEKVRYKYTDNLINIRSAIQSDGPPEHNRLWYEVAGGYVHSSWIQPVRFDPQRPLTEFPGENFLVEVSAPFTDSRLAGNPHSERSYRLYYGTTHWATAVLRDREGHAWYRIWDDKWNKRR